ncbi:hypothetical protein [Caballeronia sp. GAWG1-1]|jgi:hypothetical protein|uniref:hypothetical protein n=2 Tax=Caballeronia TaxID=1827195 RepID=UPI002028BEA3|nr:hypothetical protein [Caballeronia sp. GAWG1-1]
MKSYLANEQTESAMDDSLIRLRAKIARQIAEREATLQPMRDYAVLGGNATPERTYCPVTLAALEQDLCGWKRMAAKLETTVLFEPREHRALRMPRLR